MTPPPTHPLLRWGLTLTVALASAGLLPGCALQPPAATTLPAPPAAWALAPAAPAKPASAAPDDRWWQALPDPALPRLIDAAQAGSPTLALAAARLEESRALLRSAGASALPQAKASAGSTRGNSAGIAGSAPVTQSSAALNLSWELDLFGRIAHDRAAAQARLDAREADARATRLSLQANLASTLLGRRACAQLLDAQALDIQSRETTLALTERKLAAGMATVADRARVQSGLADARGTLASTRSQCQQLTASLVALSTLGWAEVEALAGDGTPLPVPPPQAPGLPATVLAGHPSLQAAVKTADAAFEDVGAARAARLPSLSLSGLLGRQWLGLGGAAGTTSASQWSLGGTLAGTLFDGGAGAANVDASRARHAQALAQLQDTLLTTVQNVEDALSTLTAAQARDSEAEAGLAAAQTLFDANDASWRAGRISLLDLEDARRTLQSARTALITARRDRAQAWVALVKATGNALTGA